MDMLFDMQQNMHKEWTAGLQSQREMHQECLEGIQSLQERVDSLSSSLGKLEVASKSQ